MTYSVNSGISSLILKLGARLGERSSSRPGRFTWELFQYLLNMRLDGPPSLSEISGDKYPASIPKRPARLAFTIPTTL
jgi:hypothetical protein